MGRLTSQAFEGMSRLMSTLGASNFDRVAQRCNDLETAYRAFLTLPDVEVLSDSATESKDDQKESRWGIRLNRTALFEAVTHHFSDIDRYKKEHGIIGEGLHGLANDVKVGAFLAYWISEKHPIYDMHDQKGAVRINERFALYAGLAAARVNFVSAQAVAEGVPFRQLRSLLTKRRTTPDALVPTFGLLTELCPYVEQSA
jgi:hypothetical protein